MTTEPQATPVTVADTQQQQQQQQPSKEQFVESFIEQIFGEAMEVIQQRLARENGLVSSHQHHQATTTAPAAGEFSR